MTIIYGNWTNLYPCEDCDYLLGPSAFSDGRIYQPCPQCGGRIGFSIAGRAMWEEEIVQKKLFGLIKYKKRNYKFLRWEKR